MKDNIAIGLSVIAIGMAGYAISIPTEITNEIVQFDQTGLNETLKSFDQRITDQGLTIGQVQDNMSDIAEEVSVNAKQLADSAWQEMTKWFEWAKSNLPNWLFPK